MLYNTILDTIGKTPLVRFQRVAQELDCELYGKCEFLNPGGSLKDRIAKNMIEAAEEAGQIKPGDTLIEATSGNTGIGLAMAAAAKGYKLIITMPEKMSREKETILKALGATIYRTPTEAAFDAPESHISLAKKLKNKISNAHILDQYNNPANPDIHYHTTAQEILEDAGKDLKMVVISVGTGGTITGVARKIKEVKRDVRIVGVDPYGSILGGGTEVFPYKVEGIGYDFFPKVLDNSLVDEYVKTRDKESFLMARRLLREEGMLVGGSSGATLCGALKAARSLKKGEKCVAILADGVRNYLTKFADEEWMKENGFWEENQ